MSVLSTSSSSAVVPVSPQPPIDEKKETKILETHVVDSEASALHAGVENSLSVGHVDVLGALVAASGFEGEGIGGRRGELGKERDKRNRSIKTVSSTLLGRRRPQRRERKRQSSTRLKRALFLSFLAQRRRDCQEAVKGGGNLLPESTARASASLKDGSRRAHVDVAGLPSSPSNSLSLALSLSLSSPPKTHVAASS